MTTEPLFLKAQSPFQAPTASVEQAIGNVRIDAGERDLFPPLLRMGLTLPTAFVAGHGGGDVGPTLAGPDGHTWQRRPEAPARPDKSVLGAWTVHRFGDGMRVGQTIEAEPRDQRRGLPASDFSYVREDGLHRLCVKESFAEAGAALGTLLGLRGGGGAAGER